MAETSSKKGTTKKKKGGKKIELTIRDMKFIQAVDQILEANRKEGIEPSTDNALGKLIYPSNRSIVTAVRTALKHIPDVALSNLAHRFDIDMNFFYRDQAPFKYKPQKGKSPRITNTASDKGIVIAGDNAPNTHIEGDNNGEIIGILNGNVYKGNKIGEIIQRADKIINNKFEPDQREMCEEILGSVKQEAESMENLILQKSEDIKKIANLYEAQLRTEKQRNEGLQEELQNMKEELSSAKENERELLKKYTNLLEKNSK